MDTNTIQEVQQQPSHASLYELEQMLCSNDINSRTLGTLGERYASLWLEERGWQVLGRNWACRYGELDIIMLERDGTLVFVEVKTRRTLRYGSPQEAITKTKQLNLSKAALLWLSEHGNRIRHTGIRFDAISLWVHNGHALTHWIPGAF